jgi:hypothetical protein
MLTGRWLRSTFATLALSCAAHASSINVFSTGVNASGNVLPNGTIVDPHYTLVTVPGLTTDIRVLASGFPVGTWNADDSISAWIGPNNSSQLDGPGGTYDYQTTFDLTGLDYTTASLAGQWATDNTGVDILINGHSTGINSPCFACFTFTGFSISSGFGAGVNTLDFIVQNGTGIGDTAAGPTGLRVEFLSATADPAPEPASFVLIGAGLLALSRLRRRIRA